jgi:hypothetical protein
MGAMTVRDFLVRRLVRLHPLVMLGALLGLASYLGDPFADGRQHASAALVALAFVAAMLALPSPPLPNRLGTAIRSMPRPGPCFRNISAISPMRWSCVGCGCGR